MIALAAALLVGAPSLALSVYRDRSGALDSVEALEMTPVEGARYNAGYTTDTLHFCAEVSAETPIVVVPGNFDSLAFTRGEVVVPPAPWLARVHAVRAAPGSAACFRVASDNAINVEPFALSFDAFVAHVTAKTYSDGIYYGTIAAILVFNVIAFFALRDGSRLSYIVYQATYLAVQLGFDGVWLAVLPLHKRIEQRFELLLLALVLLSALAFSRRFLALSPRASRPLLVGTWLVLGAALVLWLEAAFLIVAIGSFVIPAAIIALAIPGLLRGDASVRLFVAGFGVFLIAIGATVLTDVGAVPSLLPYDATTKVGSVIEALLLTAALGVRIAQVRREKEMHERGRVDATRTLVAGVAHEIGNPLNAALGAHAEIDRRLVEAPPPVRAGLAILGRGLARIHAIVDAVRAGLQGGGVPARAISAASALEETIALIAPELGAKNVRVERHGVGTSLCAPGELEQVLHNLLVNALHATPKDSTITVSIVASQSGLTITVEDGGNGVPADARARIFDAFFTTKPAQSGTGLGLWVSREICRRRGGNLILAPQGDRGARFVVTLPRV